MKFVPVLLLALAAGACSYVPVADGGHRGGQKAGGDTVLICHKGKKTMELPASAVSGHMNHGDRRGPC